MKYTVVVGLKSQAGPNYEVLEMDVEAVRASDGIWQVRHSGVGGVYQHYELSVAVLDLLRVGIIQLHPEWCKRAAPTPHTREEVVVNQSDIDRILEDANRKV